MRAALLLVPLLLPAPRPDDPIPVPIQVVPVVTPVSDGGAFTLHLACTPSAAVEEELTLALALCQGIEDVATWEHPIEPSTRGWKRGATVDLALPLELPEGVAFDEQELVSLRIGFRAGAGGKTRPPDVFEHLIDPDGYADLVGFEVPRFAGSEGAARLRAVLAEADALHRDDPPAAWALLAQALRDAADDANKERVRDALVEIGRFPPATISDVEQRVVAQRIRAEQVRVFRLEAGRMAARGQLHAALRLLEEVGGALALDVDEKVLGALNDAERTTQRIEDIRERLLTELSTDDQAAVDAAVEEHGRTEDLLEHADALAESAQRPRALALYRKLRRVDGIELYDAAQERLEVVGAEHLADTPPAQEQALRAVREHPAWARTDTVASHEFLYIGPRDLVRGIPDESKLRFDLAYLFLTDLFGRVPNPRGDRVTVYFKELWEFGGGVGGGKIIDIGRAQPHPEDPVRVDTGLLYHELTHCIDDTLPVTGGFREGLANLGAAYAHEALDQDGDALHSFEGNLRQFEDFYLGRDLEYWRIQNYGPSAGLFLYFVDTYFQLGRSQHDWTPLRRFFREYRDAPVRDGREPQVARSLAYYLVRAFGPQAFDDLMRFRFPLIESDRRLLHDELEGYETEDLFDFEDAFEACPNSPLPRDLVAKQLARAANRDDLEACAELRPALGVVFEWKVIGPFFAAEADPGAHVFPPEVEIDFAEKPRTLRSSKRDHTQLVWQDPWPSWRPTSSHKNAELRPSGWLRFDYQPYGDNDSAIYALTHVTVEEAVGAVAHLRADDDVTLIVNDRCVGTYRGRGVNGSSERWRGPYQLLPDAQRFPVTLEPGRNKVLVKIRNRSGVAGAALALARPDGSPLAFAADAGPPDPVGPREPVREPRYWKRLVTVDHRALRSKAETTVGGFRARNKAFHGAERGGGVAWRQWTVRPGFPKDSPSNLLWVKGNVTKKLEGALRVRVALDSPEPPKMLVTVQGEGGTDGLSGWNLILVPRRQGVSARLERYDRLVYESDPVELPAAEDGRELLLTLWDGWATATIDGVTLLDRVSVDPIPGRHRVGVATWGTEPVFREIEVFEGR